MAVGMWYRNAITILIAPVMDLASCCCSWSRWSTDSSIMGVQSLVEITGAIA
jgi:hypothetical protein